MFRRLPVVCKKAVSFYKKNTHKTWIWNMSWVEFSIPTTTEEQQRKSKIRKGLKMLKIWIVNVILIVILCPFFHTFNSQTISWFAFILFFSSSPFFVNILLDILRDILNRKTSRKISISFCQNWVLCCYF